MRKEADKEGSKLDLALALAYSLQCVQDLLHLLLIVHFCAVINPSDQCCSMPFAFLLAPVDRF